MTTYNDLFLLAPGFGKQLKKNVTEIQYVGWDGKKWTANVTTSGFHTVRQGTNITHDSRYFYYLTRNSIGSAARLEGSAGESYHFTVAPDPNHPLPQLLPITLPHLTLPPVHNPPQPPPAKPTPCASPIGVTFIVTADCYVGLRSDPTASWGTISLHKGQRYVRPIPSGQILLYGTGTSSSQGGTLEIYPKGSVGRCDVRYVP